MGKVVITTLAVICGLLGYLFLLSTYPLVLIIFGIIALMAMKYLDMINKEKR